MAFIAPCISYANTVESGPFKISQLRFGEGGVHVALDPITKGCGSGNQYGMHLKLDPTVSDNHGEMTSSLLAANATGQKLSRIWFRNSGQCSSHILHLYILEFQKK